MISLIGMKGTSIRLAICWRWSGREFFDDLTTKSTFYKALSLVGIGFHKNAFCPEQIESERIVDFPRVRCTDVEIPHRCQIEREMLKPGDGQNIFAICRVAKS